MHANEDKSFSDVLVHSRCRCYRRVAYRRLVRRRVTVDKVEEVEEVEEEVEEGVEVLVLLAVNKFKWKRCCVCC